MDSLSTIDSKACVNCEALRCAIMRRAAFLLVCWESNQRWTSALSISALSRSAVNWPVMRRYRSCNFLFMASAFYIIGRPAASKVRWKLGVCAKEKMLRFYTGVGRSNLH